jgi:hypothetical protein
MGKRDELSTVTVTLQRETPGAWFVRGEGMTVDVTLPKSRVEFPSDAEQGNVVDLEVPAWLMEEKGLA